MKISINRYDALLKAEAQKEILKREMQSRVKDGTDWISFDALKTIFDLWDIVPEMISPNKNNGCDTDV